jgi:hypothetical protein
MHSSYAAIDIVAGGKRAQNESIKTKQFNTKFFKQAFTHKRKRP